MSIPLFALNTLFHQTSNLSFPSGYSNSESVTYFCISDEYSPRPLDKKVQSMASNLTGFHVSKMTGITEDLKHKRN